MTVVLISEMVYAEPRPKTTEERQQKHDAILAELNTPMHLGRCTAVTYDQKADRYAATFIPASEKKLTLKASNDAVKFISRHIEGPGYWLGRMEDGVLVEVNLIQA
jgi:hypothetical protein